jgi:eukaryotic-like serine/threonine-protein kinase
VSTSQQADPLIGRLVDGRYRVRARIARGGMATVYVATDLRLERRIALKVMHGHLSDDTVFQSRFIQEARAAARLADPHVVNVFDQGQDGDMAYLVMEYLPGITLRELMREHRRLSVPQTITIMDAVLSGLAAAHRAGIVHRDVKPENVLLAEDGRIKIGDFGLARATTANTATGQQLLGTIAYLAPELVTRGTADARSDIYALGIMLYEMLVGEQPYKGEQPMQIAYQHATDSVPRPSVKNTAIPEQLDELVLWATEKVPDDRPLDASAMLDRLREIERELGVAPQVARAVSVGVTAPIDGIDSGEVTKVFPVAGTGPTSVVDDSDNAARLRARTKRRARRGGWLVALVLVLAGLAAGAGWWFGSGPGSLVAVADVSGLSFAEAQARLAEDTLVAQQEDVYDLDIPAGQVVDTDPPPGARVDKDTAIAVRVSLGPQPHDIPALSGTPIDQARTTVESLNLTPGDEAREFSDQADGTVMNAFLAPRAGGDPIECGGGCRALEGDTVTFVVSVGAVPDVAGMSTTEASNTLGAVELSVDGATIEQNSESIEEGDVIGIAAKEDGSPWRPGDTVTLIVSIGPPLFEVPDVEDRTLAEARQILSDAGFRVSYNSAWDLFPIATVTGQNPSAGSMRVQGTTVELRVSFSD